MDDYERVLLVKPDVHVYKIPPRVSNRAYRASEWNLDTPDWNCRLRLISKGNECYLKLDERSTGQFFGKCPIDKYPGAAIEPVSDSSRYFVLRLVNEQTGRIAFIGIGFADRSDSFDFNVALQDHFKIVELENKSSSNEFDENTPKLDLKFKEGETIKVNLNIGAKTGSKPRPKSSSNKGGGLGILLPPPPSNINKQQPSNPLSLSSRTTTSDHSEFNPEKDIFDGLESLHISNGSGNLSLFKFNDGDAKTSVPKNNINNDWLDFADAKSNTSKTTTLVDDSPFSPKTENTKNHDLNVESSVETAADLWSDFTSCNIQEGNTTIITTATTNSDSSSSSQFSEWAKFS